MNKKYFIKNSLFIITCILVLFFYFLVNIGTLPLHCQNQCNFSIAKGENLKSISQRLKLLPEGMK